MRKVFKPPRSLVCSQGPNRAQRSRTSSLKGAESKARLGADAKGAGSEAESTSFQEKLLETRTLGDSSESGLTSSNDSGFAGSKTYLQLQDSGSGTQESSSKTQLKQTTDSVAANSSPSNINIPPTTTNASCPGGASLRTQEQTDPDFGEFTLADPCTAGSPRVSSTNDCDSSLTAEQGLLGSGSLEANSGSLGASSAGGNGVNVQSHCTAAAPVPSVRTQNTQDTLDSGQQQQEQPQQQQQQQKLSLQEKLRRSK